MGDSSSRYRFTMARLLGLLRGDTGAVWVVVAYALGIGLCSLAVPIAVKSLVNSVTFASLLQPLVVLTAITGVVLAVSGVMSSLQYYVVELLQRRIFVRLSLSLAMRLPHVEHQLFFRTYGPSYVTRFMEVFNLQKIAALLLLDSLGLFVQTVIGLLLLGLYHPIFLGFSLLLGLAVMVIVFGLGRGAFRTSIAESDSKYEMVTWLQEIARIPVLFKSNEGEKFAIGRTDALAVDYLRRREDHFRVLLRQHISALVLQLLASCALLGLGGWLVIEGQLTLGQLVAAELIITMVLGSVTKFGKHLEKLYDLGAAVVKLDSVLSLPQEELSGRYFGVDQKPAPLTAEGLVVEIDGKRVIAGLDLDVPAGGQVAVIGGDGSGKSVLADVIYRLLLPTAGRVEIDGHGVKEINPLELRSEVALVRHIEIFSGTVEENLTLGRGDVTAAEIRSALEAVRLAKEVASLPQGLSTKMTGYWGPFSRGQAARLMIARALCMKPRVLVIDGILDHVDETLLSDVFGAVLAEPKTFTTLVLTTEEYVASHLPVRYRLVGGRLERAP